MIPGIPLSANSRSCARICSGSRSPFRNQNGRMPYSRGGIANVSSVTGTAGQSGFGRGVVDISVAPDHHGGLDEPGGLVDRHLEPLAHLVQAEPVRDEIADHEAAGCE